MQVEQKNIWEDVTRNAKRDNSNRAIAAYQANMPDAGAVARKVQLQCGRSAYRPSQ